MKSKNVFNKVVSVFGKAVGERQAHLSQLYEMFLTVVNVCGKVVGERQEHLSQLYECRVVQKTGVIVDDSSYALAKYYELFASGR